MPHLRARARLVVVAEQQAALELAADAAQRGCGQHAFRCAARAHVDVDGGVLVGHRDHARDIAIGDQHDAAAEAAQFGDQVGMARAVEHAHDDVVGLYALGSSHGLDVLGRRACRGR